MWTSLCDANFAVRWFRRGYCIRPHCNSPPPPRINFSVLQLQIRSAGKLSFGSSVFLPYSSYCFLYFLPYENCSCWVWKLSNDACPLYIMHFIIHSTLFDCNFPFLFIYIFIYVLIHIKYYPKNFTFIILRILELYARKVCIMFVYKHTETIEYVKK